MSVQDPKLKLDGQFDFSGGADSHVQPVQLAENYVAFAVNAAFGYGDAGQRDGAIQLGFTYDSENAYTWFRTKRPQGWGIYIRPKETFLVLSVEGRIFYVSFVDSAIYEATPRKTLVIQAFVAPAVDANVTITVDDAEGAVTGHPLWVMGKEYEVVSADTTANTVTVTNIADTAGTVYGANTPGVMLDANASWPAQTWFCQADKYLVIQNGVDRPVIFDFPNVRRSDEKASEVPVGTVMAYVNGRLWVAISKQEFVAGDIVGSDTGVLKFTENTYLNEGYAFSIPSVEGEIRAMVPLSSLDTSLGQGALLIGTDRSIFTVNAPVDRDTWKDLTYPIQTYGLLDYGIESQNSAVTVNADLFFRSKAGWKTFIIARRDFSSWGNTPVSAEMNRVLNDDDLNLLKFGSAIYWGNRLYFTVNPVPDDQFAWHRGLGVLDFDPISTMGEKKKPAYDALWTGAKVYGVTKLDNRAIVIARGGDDNIEFWEILPGAKFDNNDQRIETQIETRAYAFQNPYEMKKLKGLDIFLRDVVGKVDFEVFWRPDGYPCWFTWHSFQECQSYRTCTTTGACDSITVLSPECRTRIRCPEPPTSCYTSDNKPASCFYTVQLLLKWTGHAVVTRVILRADTVEEYV